MNDQNRDLPQALITGGGGELAQVRGGGQRRLFDCQAQILSNLGPLRRQAGRDFLRKLQ